MTLHLPPRKPSLLVLLLRSGWGIAVVLAALLVIEHTLLHRSRAELSLSRQETARLRLVEQELYRLKMRQDRLVDLLQLPGNTGSDDTSSSITSGLAEAALPDVGIAPSDTAHADLSVDDPVPHLWPVGGWVTQEFRPPRSPRHHGIDIAEKLGSPVVAPARAEVLRVYWDDTMGRVLELQHPEGHLTRYAHLQTVEVQPGEMVEAGQMVARLGTSGKSTAPHLHYEVELRSTLLDPSQFLPNYAEAAMADDAFRGTR